MEIPAEGPDQEMKDYRLVMLSIVKIQDVKGEPKAMLDLPGPLRLGDPVALCFCVERRLAGRTEILEVKGRFQVEAVGFDAQRVPVRQLVTVSSLGLRPPVWRSIKQRPEPARRLGPACFPRTPVM